MEIFKNIKNSIYGPEFYNEIKNKSFSYSLKYFFIFSLIVAFLFCIILSIVVIPKIKGFLDVVGKEIIDRYPAELIVEIKDGKASSNVQEPYFIKAPPDWNVEWNGRVENIIVIDTINPFSVKKFEEYKSFCVLSKETLACYGENQTIEVNSLSQIPNTTIDKNLVSLLFNKIKPFLNFIYPIVVIFIFIGLYVFLLLKLAYLLLAAFLIWLVAGIKNFGIKYKKSYQLGLHLITLPTLLIFFVKYPLGLLGIHFNFPFLFTIILLITAIFNLKPKIKDINEQSDRAQS